MDGAEDLALTAAAQSFHHAVLADGRQRIEPRLDVGQARRQRIVGHGRPALADDGRLVPDGCARSWMSANTSAISAVRSAKRLT